MQNMNGTTQEFGAPVSNAYNPGFNGGNQGTQGYQGYQNGQRRSYPTPCSIDNRPKNQTPEYLFASLIGRIYQPKIEMRQNSNGQMVKVFSCNLMTVKQASTFNYHFGPYGADGKIIPIFPENQETIYVSVNVWESPTRQTVTNYIEKMNLNEGDQVFVGGRLKCTTSNNPQYSGRYFLNMSAKDFAIVSRSRTNSQGNGQGNGNYQGGYSTPNQNQYQNPNVQAGTNQYANTANPYANQTEPVAAPAYNQAPTNYGYSTTPSAPAPSQSAPTSNQGLEGMPTAPAYNNPLGEAPNFSNPEVASINISDDDLPF